MAAVIADFVRGPSTPAGFLEKQHSHLSNRSTTPALRTNTNFDTPYHILRGTHRNPISLQRSFKNATGVGRFNYTTISKNNTAGEHSRRSASFAYLGCKLATRNETSLNLRSMSILQHNFQNLQQPSSPRSSPQPGSLVCPECGREFDQIHKLNHHKRYHDRAYECAYPDCDRKFGTRTHLDRHINDRHLKLKAYHCTDPTCAWFKGGKSFPRKENWRRHMIKNHGSTPRDFEGMELYDPTMQMPSARLENM
ncbi:hypothetical protein F4680DRAFT_192726 [Xylaria scruposa]|nr:hypothetical protein F4680DRAFT_192726 [Xylaria scruposa]